MVLRPIEIKVRTLSPFWLKFLGLLIFFAANVDLMTLAFSKVNLFTLVLLNLIAFAIWTGKEIVIIDFDARQIIEGYKILGLLAHAEKYRFSVIEKIYVNKILTSQVFYRLASQTKIHDQIYKAFLKTDEGDKFCIGQNRNKDQLIQLLKRYNQTAKSVIIDNTLTEPAVIDS